MVRSGARGPVPRRTRIARDGAKSPRGASTRRARSSVPEPAPRPACRRGVAWRRRPRRSALVASRPGALRLGRSFRRSSADHGNRPHLRLQSPSGDRDRVLAADGTARGQPQPGDHRRLQPADERAGGRGRGAHPAGGQGVVLLEEQQPRDFARVSPRRKYALCGEHRPDRDPFLVGSFGNGADQHRLRDRPDADAGPSCAPVAQACRSRCQRRGRIAAVRPRRLGGQHCGSPAGVRDNVTVTVSDHCHGNPVCECDADPRRRDHAVARNPRCPGRLPRRRSSRANRSAGGKCRGVLAEQQIPGVRGR